MEHICASGSPIKRNSFVQSRLSLMEKREFLSLKLTDDSRARNEILFDCLSSTECLECKSLKLFMENFSKKALFPETGNDACSGELC